MAASYWPSVILKRRKVSSSTRHDKRYLNISTFSFWYSFQAWSSRSILVSWFRFYTISHQDNHLSAKFLLLRRCLMLHISSLYQYIVLFLLFVININYKLNVSVNSSWYFKFKIILPLNIFNTKASFFVYASGTSLIRLGSCFLTGPSNFLIWYINDTINENIRWN